MSNITAAESWSTTRSRAWVLDPVQATDVKEMSVDEVMADHSAVVTASAPLPIWVHKAPNTESAADFPMSVIGFQIEAMVTFSSFRVAKANGAMEELDGFGGPRSGLTG
jgi:hypothetical protein